jgi:hypothetical protein
MKNKAILLLLAGGILFLLQSFLSNRKPAPDFPEEVNGILVSSCFDCHSSAGKNDDARKKLNFESWDDYKLTKKIGLLGDIAKVIEKDEMPPGKYLEFKPDRKLTDEQKKVILNWTEETSNALMEGNK